jgi:hypothetical protein
VVLSRLWLSAAFVIAAWVAPLASAMPEALGTNQPPAIPVIERNLAHALAKSRTTLILRLHKHRTRTPQHVNAVEWVDLANGRSRVRWYDASGRLTSDTSRSYSGKLPSAACGCDLDPFTNFLPTEPRVSLLGQQTIDRKPTVHLRFTVTGGPVPSTTDIWIDRSTYLPVREQVGFRQTTGNSQRRRQIGPTITTTNDFTWLPRTSANLAHLTGG